MELILIKYGELTTKGQNRKLFINYLEKNIRKMFIDEKIVITKNNVRMFIECEDSSKAILKLKKVFGIHSIVVCYKVNNNIDDILNKVLEIINTDKKTFKVVTNRADKSYPIFSMDFSKKLGGLILKNTDLKVDVHNPDITVNVEIRNNGIYVFTDSVKGAGGYPVGVAGNGLLMLSGGIDSPVAGYLAMKRGVNVECLYFDAPPHTSRQAQDKVIKLASILNEYSGEVKLHIVPFTKLQEAIYKNCPSDYMITIMRRMMYRIAQRYCLKNNFKIIINGESIGQVASQTLSSMMCINSVVDIPVIRPVACFDKLEIIDLANKIGTYETSILPYEDCCTIFVPKHPVINPSIDLACKYEKSFDFEKLIDEAIENINIVSNFTKNDFFDIL